MNKELCKICLRWIGLFIAASFSGVVVRGCISGPLVNASNKTEKLTPIVAAVVTVRGKRVDDCVA